MYTFLPNFRGISLMCTSCRHRNSILPPVFKFKLRCVVFHNFSALHSTVFNRVLLKFTTKYKPDSLYYEEHTRSTRLFILPIHITTHVSYFQLQYQPRTTCSHYWLCSLQLVLSTFAQACRAVLWCAHKKHGGKYGMSKFNCKLNSNWEHLRK